MRMGLYCVVGLFLLCFFARASSNKCFQGTFLKEVNSDHLFFKLKPPIVIGHMGNIESFQENTLEGMKNLIAIKAGGMHFHVRMTKDKQLVLFQDDNLYRMTGENFMVSKLPYSEILKMNLQTTINYYSDAKNSKIIRKFNYPSERKIPLLSTVLKEVRGKGLLIYIEMMPNNVPPKNPLDRQIAMTTAELLSKMLKEYEVEKEVLVVSRDAFKVFAFNSYNQNVPHAWVVDSELYEQATSNAIKVEYDDFPQIYENKCFENIQENGTEFMKKVFTSGLVSKVVNASFLDTNVRVFKENQFYVTEPPNSKLKDVVSAYYGPKTSIGVLGVYSWRDVISTQEDKKYIKQLVGLGASRLITNDVNRVKRALDEIIVSPSKSNPALHCYLLFIMLTLLFGKMAVDMVFI